MRLNKSYLLGVDPSLFKEEYTKYMQGNATWPWCDKVVRGHGGINLDNGWALLNNKDLSPRKYDEKIVLELKECAILVSQTDTPNGACIPAHWFDSDDCLPVYFNTDVKAVIVDLIKDGTRVRARTTNDLPRQQGVKRPREEQNDADPRAEPASAARTAPGSGPASIEAASCATSAAETALDAAAAATRAAVEPQPGHSSETSTADHARHLRDMQRQLTSMLAKLAAQLVQVNGALEQSTTRSLDASAEEGTTRSLDASAEEGTTRSLDASAEQAASQYRSFTMYRSFDSPATAPDEEESGESKVSIIDRIRRLERDGSGYLEQGEYETAERHFQQAFEMIAATQARTGVVHRSRA